MLGGEDTRFPSVPVHFSDLEIMLSKSLKIAVHCHIARFPCSHFFDETAEINCGGTQKLNKLGKCFMKLENRILEEELRA